MDSTDSTDHPGSTSGKDLKVCFPQVTRTFCFENIVAKNYLYDV